MKMGYVKEPEGVNLNIKGRPLTKADEKAFSEYIVKRKKELGLDEDQPERKAS